MFAHPDDEAFGPGGSIAIFAKDHDVYVICVTNGDAGKNSSKKTEELSEIRRKELLESAKILGVKKVYFLGYKDGSLCNNMYHDVARNLKLQLEKIKPETILTFENRGISGHIDHIAVSMATTYVFERLSFAKTLLYYCISDRSRELNKEYYIYFPPGYKKSEIDKVVQTKDVWDTKVKAMHCHQSQIHDVERILKNQAGLPKEEYFLVKTK